MAFATVVCDQFVVLSCVLVMIIDLVTDILMCACVCVCVYPLVKISCLRRRKNIPVKNTCLRCNCYYIIIDRFYIALFSALEQTHCARM